MNLSIVGTGYVGLVTGACFAEAGMNVTCIDSDKEKIETLRKGIITVYEPGLEELVVRNYKLDRLKFSTSLEESLDNVSIIFIAVDTSSCEDANKDIRDVLDVARTIGMTMNKYALIVIKSTVPVGTARKVKMAIQEELDKKGLSVEFDVVSNPEFLKEGSAVADFITPDRVVIGVDSERARDIMTQLYNPFLLNNSRVIFMDIPSAEMTKYAANAMLATRISFMNDIANLCELVGANIDMVRLGIGYDTRIGRKYLNAGCGYGGSCFPKDIKTLLKMAENHGYTMKIMNMVEEVNDLQKKVLFSKLENYYQSNLAGKTIAVWGLSYKPGTDDIQEAPSMVVIQKLLDSGCNVRVYDPVAMNVSRKRLGETVYYSRDMYDALLDADALLVVTEWKEFRRPAWGVVKKTMNNPVVFDGRNIYDSEELAEHGIIYHCIGRNK